MSNWKARTCCIEFCPGTDVRKVKRMESDLSISAYDFCGRHFAAYKQIVSREYAAAKADPQSATTYLRDGATMHRVQ